jgi:threonine/homoserine/homoserine lactone efflux protein
MVTVDQLASFAAVSFVLIVIPGPSVMFVIGRALAHGHRTALGSVLGNAVGVYVVAAAVAFGVGLVVERSEIIFTTVKLVGAAYLIWLGIQAIRQRRSLRSMLRQPPAAQRSTWQAVREGFTVGVANPKAVILFAAILPQFVNQAAGNVPAQMLVLSLVSFVIALVSDSAWGLAASGARTWFAKSPRRLELVGGIGGIAIIGVGLGVAVTGRKS